MLWIVFVILFGIIFLFCLIVTIVSLYAFTKMFGRRYDGNPYVHYFTVEDFEGLRAQPFSFYSDGSKLNGYIYRSDLWQGPSKGLIVFSHGFGAGHLAYTTEINYFARNGYKILAFDNTGCVKSEGDSIKGFDQIPYLDHASRPPCSKIRRASPSRVSPRYTSSVVTPSSPSTLISSASGT